jgi:hypothetical protein
MYAMESQHHAIIFNTHLKSNGGGFCLLESDETRLSFATVFCANAASYIGDRRRCMPANIFRDNNLTPHPGFTLCEESFCYILFNATLYPPCQFMQQN